MHAGSVSDSSSSHEHGAHQGVLLGVDFENLWQAFVRPPTAVTYMHSHESRHEWAMDELFQLNSITPCCCMQGI